MWRAEKLSLRLPYSLRDVTVAFSPDGTHLAVGSGDEVRVFDARSGAALQEFRHRAARSQRSCSVQTARCSLQGRPTARASGRSISTTCSDGSTERDQVAVG